MINEGKGLIPRFEKRTTKSLKILIVAAEVSPYATVGGISRVVEQLAKALSGLGHDVRIFMPKFGFLDEAKYKTTMVLENLLVPTGDGATPELVCNVKSFTPKNGITTYFFENMEYYEIRANVYGYRDDPTRWALLSRGAIEFIKHIGEAPLVFDNTFKPDVIHCNDWQTALLPNFLKANYKNDTDVSGISTLFTMHNLYFQGMFDHKNVSELDFDDGKSDIAPFFSEALNKQNFMRRGIIYSDIVNTVSPTYSKEILTPEFGENLDRLLMEVRSKLYGVLDGLDYSDFNPSTDKVIQKNYDAYSLNARSENKAALQKEFGIKVDPDIPLLGYVGRLDYQKGLDLITSSMRYLIKDFGVQFVEVGGGESSIVSSLKELKEAFPNNVGLHPLPNFTLPRYLFAGCDMILYPSRFEPCGIAQFEAMRYGAVPIVRKVGGLADSVENYDAKTGKGTGFVFEEYDMIAFYGQLVRAIETYKHKEIWRSIQKNAMRQDFSWGKSAQEYVRIYNLAIEFHNKLLNSNSFDSEFGI